MKGILLDGNPYRFKATDLPLLIHGEDSSGASLYTITLVADLYAQGAKPLFLCGYPMAEAEFSEQVGKPHEGALFFTKDDVSGFKERLADADDRIVMVKNVELFDRALIEQVLRRRHVVISGDVAAAPARDALLAARFTTKILFSTLGDATVPDLAKYEAVFVADARRGVTRLA